MEIQPAATQPPVRHRKFTGIIITAVVVCAAFGVGVLTGETLYLKKTIVNPDGTVNIDRVTNLNRALNHSGSVDFAQFWEVWDRVKQQYVHQPTKDTDMFYGAIQGMVASLGDPYSIYLPPQQATSFTKNLEGELEGIGAEIGVKQNQLVVVSPIPGTPAMQAGLRTGDKILAIDKLSTQGMDVNTAVSHIRGPATSSVELLIARDGWAKPKEIIIHRAKINVPSVLYETKPGNVAYLRVLQFNDNTIPLFSKYVDQLKASHANGLILDLRNNPGGYLDGAIAMASEWIKDGAVVSERFSDGRVEAHNALAVVHRLAGMKTVVLINGGSASASEIVSGALKDQKAATLIGEKSFGKGSVQNYENFPDGSALKVTVAEWLTPNNVNINKTGITPDIEVKENFEQEAAGQDSVIDKALQILKGK